MCVHSFKQSFFLPFHLNIDFVCVLRLYSCFLSLVKACALKRVDLGHQPQCYLLWLWIRCFILTYRNGPDRDYFDHGLAKCVAAAVFDWITDADIAVQRDGAQVHDGGCGEKHIKEDPHGTQQFRERPGVIWKQTTRGDVSETRAQTDMSRAECLVL